MLDTQIHRRAHSSPKKGTGEVRGQQEEEVLPSGWRSGPDPGRLKSHVATTQEEAWSARGTLSVHGESTGSDRDQTQPLTESRNCMCQMYTVAQAGCWPLPCFVSQVPSLSVHCCLPNLIWAPDLFRLATASISHHLQARYLFILWLGTELKGSGSAARRLFHALLIPNAVTTISFLLLKEVLFFFFFNMWPKCSNKEHHSNEDESPNLTSLQPLLCQRRLLA